MTLAQPAISTLFGNQYVEAPLYLALLAITYLYTLIGSLSVGNLINGQGQTTFNLVIAVITAVVGFPLGFVLISGHGVLGLIITSIAAAIPGAILALNFIKKRYNLTVPWKSSGKILFSSAIAAALTYAVIMQLSFWASLLQLIVGVVIFTLTYLIVAILTRSFDQADIYNLREMFRALGPLQRLFNLILNIIEKLMTSLAPSRSQRH
jgi:O-antigen/teichoic acid export membrane protein